MTRVPIVDKDDNIIEYKERDETLPTDLKRIAALWLTNTKGEILIAKRAFTKKHHPGQWGFACTGAVEEGESYEDTMRREIPEELGIHDLEITMGPKFLPHEFEGFFYMCQYFLATKDIPLEQFTLDLNEVAAVRWITPEQLVAESQKHPERFIADAENWKKWIEDKEPF